MVGTYESASNKNVLLCVPVPDNMSPLPTATIQTKLLGKTWSAVTSHQFNKQRIEMADNEAIAISILQGYLRSTGTA